MLAEETEARRVDSIRNIDAWQGQSIGAHWQAGMIT